MSLENLNIDEIKPINEKTIIDDQKQEENVCDRKVATTTVSPYDEEEVYDEETQQRIREIQKLLLEEYEKNPDIYEKSDVERALNQDWHIQRLFEWRTDIESVMEFMLKIMRYRREIEMCRFTDEDYPAEFFKLGSVVPFGYDKNGYGVLYMRPALYVKVKKLDAEAQRFVMHNIEKIYITTKAHGMVVLFDCTNVGWANLDMDMLWFFVQMFIHYTSRFTKYVIVYNLPRMFVFIWNLVSKAMPFEKLSKIKLVDNEQITEFIDRDNLPFYMGGHNLDDPHRIPEKCRSIKVAELEELRSGFTFKDVDKALKTYQPYLQMAEKEIEQLKRIREERAVLTD